MLCCIVLAALIAATPSSDLFEKATPAFRNFTTADGLPQNTAAALAFDAQGHLWIGTQGGLAVAEGQGFNAVAFPDEKAAPIISAILPAADGTLFVSTFGDGIFFLRDGVWAKLDAGLPSLDVRTLGEAQGSIWAGTTKGLARLVGTSWLVVVPPQRLADPSVAVLYRTSDPETLWAGTESGLLRFANNSWTLFDRGAGLPDDRVRSVALTRAPDGSTAFWVGTEGGLGQLRDGHFLPLDNSLGLPAFPIYALAGIREADGDSLWIATYGGGVARLHDGKLTVFDKHSGLPSDVVASLAVRTTPSGQTQIWIGCDEGLARLVDGGFRAFPDGPQFLRDKVFAMLALDSGPSAGFWIASDSGLSRFERNGWSAVAMPGRKDDRPFSFAPALDGSLLVGTAQGQILQVVGSRAVAIPFPQEEEGNSIRGLAELMDPVRGRELWVARRNGLLVRRGDDWKSYDTSDGLKGNWQTGLAVVEGEGKRETLWVGGWSGLSRFDGERFTSWDATSGLPGNLVVSMLSRALPERRELWLATVGGAVRLDPDHPSKMQIFSQHGQPPLPADTVYTIQSDRQGRIYLCTERGVARLTEDGNHNVSEFTFNKEDGLPSPECTERSSTVDSSGRLWVGTAAGVAVYDPSREPKRTGAASPLVIERTLLHGRPRNLDNARLRYDENALQFEYSLLGYFRADETRYQTQLVGVDEAPTDWTTDTKREFTTLPSGNYEFRVLARDYAGVIAGPVIRKFHIGRAPWASIYAYILYACAVAGLVVMSVALRTRTLKRERGILEEKVAVRTKQLDERNNQLEQANSELVASQREADRIFSALAEALEGKVLDERYRLEERIGQGGFGAVFRATDLREGGLVAVKVFRPQSGNDSADAVERFRQEAHSGQQVNHKNAVAVLGSGVTGDGILYLVMQLLAGHSLKVELEKVHKLPAVRAAGIAVQILAALAEAHRQGIIHRDIKPDNVFLHRGPDGEMVKLVDFGVAKMKAPDSQDRSMTLTGSVVGTPTYMAPERLENRPYDGRSDVYSVGIVLYEMLVGAPPFDSQDGNIWSLILMHVRETPKPPEQLEPSVPRQISALTLLALTKDALERPAASQLAAQLADALAAITKER